MQNENGVQNNPSDKHQVRSLEILNEDFSQPINTQLNPINNSTSIVSKKNHKGLVAGLIIIIILMLVLSGCWYYFNNPKIIFAKSINSLYTKTMNTVDKNPLLNEIFANNKVGITSEVELELKEIAVSLNLPIEKMTLNFDYTEDKFDESAYLNLKAKINDSENFEFESLVKDEKFYFLLKEYFDKYYYYEDYKFASILNNERATSENIEYLLDIFKSNLIEELNEGALKDESTKINVNDKEVRVKKTSLVVTERVLANISINSIKQIQNDKEAQKILASILGMEKRELLKDLDEDLEYFQDDTIINSEEVLFNYNIYTKLFGIVVKEEVLAKDIKFESIINNGTKEYILTISDDQIINLKITTANDISEIDGLISTIKISGEIGPEKLNLKIINNEVDSAPMEINILGTYNSKEVTPKVKQEITFNLDFSANFEKNENYKFSLKSKTEIETAKSLPNIDISNSKNFEEISADEIMNIYTKIGENEMIKSFISSYTSGDYSNYNSDHHLSY